MAIVKKYQARIGSIKNEISGIYTLEIESLGKPFQYASGQFLRYSNEHGVMTRPAWQLMNRLPMFKDCQTDELTNSIWFEERVVNIPSSVIVL